MVKRFGVQCRSLTRSISGACERDAPFRSLTRRAHGPGLSLIPKPVTYPYIEWYSDRNGRVVLELDPSQVEILDSEGPVREKTPAELAEDAKKRSRAFVAFMVGLVRALSRQNRKKGGDGDVTGTAVE